MRPAPSGEVEAQPVRRWLMRPAPSWAQGGTTAGAASTASRRMHPFSRLSGRIRSVSARQPKARP